MNPNCIRLTKEKRIKIILDIKRILDKNDVGFFPLYGTLLGFVRDKGIIPHDEDADFGAWYTEYDKIMQLKDDFKKAGYRMIGSGMKNKYCHITIYPDDIVLTAKNSTLKEKNVISQMKPLFDQMYGEEYTYHVDGLPIHIPEYFPFHAGFCFFIRDNDKAVMLKFYDNNILERFARKKGLDKTKLFNIINKIYRYWLLFTHQHNVFPYEWFEKMDEQKIYDTSWSIPIGHFEYVKLTYGDNWNTPDKNFTDKKKKKANKGKKSYKIQDKNVLRMWIEDNR